MPPAATTTASSTSSHSDTGPKPSHVSSHSRRITVVLLLSLLFLCLLLPLHVSAGRDFYKILGLKRGANDKDIKKAYRQLSKQYHPDKNPNDEAAHQAFVDVAAAYECLSDKDKRRVYDQGGEDALKEREKQQAGGGGGDPFGGMFGNFFGHRQEQGEKRGDDITLDMVVTLEELYSGVVKEVKIKNRQLCEHCRGSGAESESDIHTCKECGGKGHTIHMQPIGPGFVQQVQQQCGRCGGKGKIVSKTCHVCKGAKLQKGERILDIQVEQGMDDDSKIEFENAADEHPDHAAGHLIFRVQTAPHANFTRKRHDLHYTHTLSLLESLTGFDIGIQQLDGREIRLKSSEVTPQGHIMKVKGEGMPHHTVPSQKGDLYVHLKVALPKTLTQQQKDGFAQILKGH